MALSSAVRELRTPQPTSGWPNRQTVIAPQIHAADLLDQVETLRTYAYQQLPSGQRGSLGQYFTPAEVATFLASFFDSLPDQIDLLDPGAGVGMLTAAFTVEALSREPKPSAIRVKAYEVDPILIPYLSETMSLLEAYCAENGVRFEAEIAQEDFIKQIPPCLEHGPLFNEGLERFNCVIMNPPYKKMSSDSEHRKVLSSHGLETVNLYTGFLWLAAKDLKADGQIVAIHPRSFANGPYYRPFRKQFFSEISARNVHVFNSRTDAFSDDEVLQENIIFHGTKARLQDPVRITASDSLTDPAKERFMPRQEFYDPEDADGFVHLMADAHDSLIRKQMAEFTALLSDLGINVSTGRVVDFRAKDFLQHEPDEDSIPLIYPGHCQGGRIAWPRENFKKANWFRRCDESDKQVVPAGHYVLLRRFTAKEEKRRLRAYVISLANTPASAYALENHLNYFHQNGNPLPADLAKGIAVFLNSSLADALFRQFNGHTQVNATDLRSLRYPTREQLMHIGRLLGENFPDTDRADSLLNTLLKPMPNSNSIDPIQAKKKLTQALDFLKQLDVPRAQQNERSALTLLALLGHNSKTKWSASKPVAIGITEMMNWFSEHFGVNYAPNTRETVRRQTVHQFMELGLITANEDAPDRPVNSPKYQYQIEAATLELARAYKTRKWKETLRLYKENAGLLRALHHQEREMNRIEVTLPDGSQKHLSAGGQNVLIKEIIDSFCPHYTPAGQVCYIGDAGEKISTDEQAYFKQLGIDLDPHGKMPDVVIHMKDRNWLVLIEAVTSHGPIDNKRKRELEKLFKGSQAGLVFITAFATRKVMLKYLHEISWETDVWLAENPTHLIHFDGEKFLGPYDG